MKITKSELKKMIRETLREELAKTKLHEAVNELEYYVQLRAYDENFDMYDDEDAVSITEYSYWGTKKAIIDKLNHIAKTHDFSFIFVYEGDPHNNNCVFKASDADANTDEEFDKPVIWNNSFVETNEPFMKDFYTKKP